MSKEDAKYRLKLIAKCITDIASQLAALDEDVLPEYQTRAEGHRKDSQNRSV